MQARRYLLYIAFERVNGASELKDARGWELAGHWVQPRSMQQTMNESGVVTAHVLVWIPSCHRRTDAQIHRCTDARTYARTHRKIHQLNTARRGSRVHVYDHNWKNARWNQLGLGLA